MEPDQLRRGKEFHKLVQHDWMGEIEGSKVQSEHSIRLFAKKRNSTIHRKGRIDVFINQIDDFVTIIEIKATNWDDVKIQNRVKLLGSHRRQVLKYVDKFLFGERKNVCAAIIYPEPPSTPGLKEQIETYLSDHSLQVIWYNEDQVG